MSATESQTSPVAASSSPIPPWKKNPGGNTSSGNELQDHVNQTLANSSHVSPQIDPTAGGQIVSIDHGSPGPRKLIATTSLILLWILIVGGILLVSYKNLYPKFGIPESFAYTVDKLIIKSPLPHNPQQLSRVVFTNYYQSAPYSFRTLIKLKSINGEVDTNTTITGSAQGNLNPISLSGITRSKKNPQDSYIFSIKTTSSDLFLQLPTAEESLEWYQTDYPLTSQPSLTPGQQSLEKIRIQELNNLIQKNQQSIRESLQIQNQSQIKLASSFVLTTEISKEDAIESLTKVMKTYQETQLGSAVSEHDVTAYQQLLQKTLTEPIEIQLNINPTTLLPQTATLDFEFYPPEALSEQTPTFERQKLLTKLNITTTFIFDQKAPDIEKPTNLQKNPNWYSIITNPLLKPVAIMLAE